VLQESVPYKGAGLWGKAITEHLVETMQRLQGPWMSITSKRGNDQLRQEEWNLPQRKEDKPQGGELKALNALITELGKLGFARGEGGNRDLEEK